MLKRLLFILIVSAICRQVTAQHLDTTTYSHKTKIEIRPFHVRPLLDGSLAVAGTAWTLYGFSVIYDRDSVPYSELNALNRNNVNSFDRGTTNNYNKNAKAASDYFFYGSLPLPALLLFDKRIRKDAGKIGILYLETIATTGTIYTIAAMSANRFRPYAYNTDVPLNDRSRGGARNSFFAGHVAVVGTSTFFMASIYTAYHPEMKNKWILYALAGAATATTGYLRIKAGQHFPSDVIVGALVGPTVGLLVPHFHRNKNFNDRVTILPQMNLNGGGVTAFYHLK